MSNDLIRTGFYALDSLLGGGLSPGELIVIGARPSMGKSIFGCQLAKDVAEINCDILPSLTWSTKYSAGFSPTPAIASDAMSFILNPRDAPPQILNKYKKVCSTSVP